MARCDESSWNVMSSRSDQGDPEQHRISAKCRFDVPGCLDRALHVARSCLYECNVHQDAITVNLMGNQVGGVKRATLVSGPELSDGDGFHSGGPVCRISNPARRVERRRDLLQSYLLLDNFPVT